MHIKLWHSLVTLLSNQNIKKTRKKHINKTVLRREIYLRFLPFFKGLIADLEGSYGPVFYMAGAIMIVATAILLTVSCVKKSVTMTSKEEVKVWESLLVVEKCSVV